MSSCMNKFLFTEVGFLYNSISDVNIVAEEILKNHINGAGVGEGVKPAI